MDVALQFYTPVCDNKVPSLVASLFSWRCLAASTSSFLHAAINLRPPSVTVSTHTSAFKAVAFQSPAMPNVRMSLCTQSVHYFSFPPRPLRTAPSRFPKAIRFGSRPPVISGRSPPLHCLYTYINHHVGTPKQKQAIVILQFFGLKVPD